MTDRYGFDVLANDPHAHRKPVTRDVPISQGLVVEDVESGFVGAITRIERSAGETLVELTDRGGKTRMFPLGAGYWIDGKPVRLVPPAQTDASAPDASASGSSGLGARAGVAPQADSTAQAGLTASGSRAVEHRARVARASRIWVEGRHDAELVEKVWGDDLRYEGVVVEYLEGIDNLSVWLGEFNPGPARRVGVLVDHLVPGSKESRIADEIHARFGGVLVLGHPYVDVWQAVKPGRVGLPEWPHVPRGTDIKVGTLQALGWPHENQCDIAHGWQKILSRVRTYQDLEASLIGRVEELVDFVTDPGTGS